MTQEEKLIKFFNSSVGQTYVASGHINDGVIGGLLISKPTLNTKSKRVGVSFILHQPKQLKVGRDLVDTTFLLMTYNQNAIDTIMSLDQVSYVLCRFSIHYLPKAKGYYPLCHTVEVVHRFEDSLEED